MANALRRSTERKSTVISKFNLVATTKPKSIGFVYIDGVPHKMKDGKLVPLTKVVKEEVIKDDLEENEV